MNGETQKARPKAVNLKVKRISFTLENEIRIAMLWGRQHILCIFFLFSSSERNDPSRASHVLHEVCVFMRHDRFLMMMVFVFF